MKRLLTITVILALIIGAAFVILAFQHEAESNPDWSMNATAIEACTCPMFCQCYFSTEPASHSHDQAHEGEETHYCKFNMAWKINDGHHEGTDLSEAVFWIAGDLGSGWDDGMLDWATLHFDPSVTEEQREGITAILDPLFPAEYESFTVGEDYSIEWNATNLEAKALLDGGNAAEVHLMHPPTAMSEEPAVLSNIQYWAAPRHDGFVMMPNEVQAYRTGDKAFESNGSNGFMITVDINSDDISDDL